MGDFCSTHFQTSQVTSNTSLSNQKYIHDIITIFMSMWGNPRSLNEFGSESDTEEREEPENRTTLRGYSCLSLFIQVCKMAEGVNFPVESSGRPEGCMIIGLVKYCLVSILHKCIM